MRFGSILVIVMVLARVCDALEWRENKTIGDIFLKSGITGTFVLYDHEHSVFVGNNLERAARRYVPASTFKITNTLIGLSTGTVADVDEIQPFLESPRAEKQWRQDMSLRDAIAISNILIYQGLARRIGLTAMQKELCRLGYGNANVGDAIDDFWLRGPLGISAIEQCQFLSRLARCRLPVAEQYQASTREIIFQERLEHATLYAKTGAAAMDDRYVGWWVGWVEKDDRVYSFAVNIDMPDFEPSLPRRVEIGRECLDALGVYP